MTLELPKETSVFVVGGVDYPNRTQAAEVIVMEMMGCCSTPENIAASLVSKRKDLIALLRWVDADKITPHIDPAHIVKRGGVSPEMHDTIGEPGRLLGK